ncbi:hypothetical protein [Oleidesulfovibrio sp.]|uniref:hypothetical protein n=1 Tax=Oleidesulfovibrio sp. TaxID=2909707 RepID=UPI003A87572A
MTEETLVFPDKDDIDLLRKVMQAIEEKHPGRFNDAQKLEAFTKTCERYDDSLPLERFLKRAIINCVWDRPIIDKDILARN